MSGVEWVETTEEVVVTEDRLPPERIAPTVIHVLEAETAPIQKLLDSVGQGETPQFYCEECVSLFQDQNDSENISGPSFVLDFPTSLGVPQRALLTLPYGLMIGRSSIPEAGIGVVNHGAVVSPGMHFGPFEGEVTTRENASDFSWEIYKDKDQYEYVDAAKESHSNWMRYVNCARNKAESNLLAVQYKGSILFHCCRTISPGDELLVWPSSKLLSQCSEAWNQKWISPTDSSISTLPQMFPCSHCQLPFTTAASLQKHTETSHTQLEASKTADNEAPPAVISDQTTTPPAVTSVNPDESKTCGDCGKVFKQIPHLKRHQLCVHSNKRPYCCPHCRRSFSQASGLIRHRLVHQKHMVVKECIQSKASSEESSFTASTEPSKSKEPVKVHRENGEGSQDAETAASNCADCSKSFSNEASLKKHRMFVHENLRPYVCTVCQKCFGQCHDLSRHLWSHQKQNKKREAVNRNPNSSLSLAFSCAQCPQVFSSVDLLQQHVKEDHSDSTAAENQDVNPIIVVEIVQNLSSQRPQRLGARSKISAITRLLSPKRRASSPAQSGNDSAEADAAATDANLNSTNSKWFCCPRCKQTYGNAADLQGHRCSSKVHRCGQCGVSFSKPGFLKRHVTMAHENAKSYSCDRCGKVFTTSGNLKQHQKINTCKKYHCSSELFPCSYCQFSFTVKSYLLKHIKRHHPVEYLTLCDSDGLGPELQEGEEGEEEEGGDKEHVCQLCGKRCANSKTLKSHKCPPQVKLLYLCTDCGKGFSNQYGLKQHQRIHTGEKPYSCPHCSKSFSYVGQLNVHLRTHTGEKPYLCTHCGESFRQSGDLKRHERKHTGVRPHSCPECSKSFSRPQSLKAHQMLHRGQRMFKCTQCGKSFSRNYHLRRHHQKMHS